MNCGRGKMGVGWEPGEWKSSGIGTVRLAGKERVRLKSRDFQSGESREKRGQFFWNNDCAIFSEKKGANRLKNDQERGRVVEGNRRQKLWEALTPSFKFTMLGVHPKLSHSLKLERLKRPCCFRHRCFEERLLFALLGPQSSFFFLCHPIPRCIRLGSISRGICCVRVSMTIKKIEIL